MLVKHKMFDYFNLDYVILQWYSQRGTKELMPPIPENEEGVVLTTRNKVTDSQSHKVQRV